MKPTTQRSIKPLSVFFVFIMAVLIAACKKESPAPTGPTPVSQNYKVYVGGQDNNLYAFNGNNGNLIWQFQSGGSFSYSTPALENSTIYSTNTDGNLYAIKQSTGTLKWKFATGTSNISSPAVNNGVVFFGSENNYFYAVDTTGTLKWKYLTQGNVDTSPAVLNNMVYFGSTDGYLYALDCTTGDVKWKYNTGGIIVESEPLISNGVVFIGNRNGDLNAIDALTGTLKWKTNIDGISLEMARFAVNNGILYYASWYSTPDFNTKGNLYAVNENDGRLLWTSLKNQGFTSGPAYANGKLFINSDDGNIYAVNAADGTEIWRKEILANGSVPAVANGKVFAGGGGSRSFHVFDVTNGHQTWSYPLPNSLDTSKPLIVAE
jgi:outer membrane protein assembly factor BamB